jgi:hypothetical protein
MLGLCRAIPNADFREFLKMHLCKPAEVPNVIQGRVCRQSRLTSVFGALLLVTLLAGIPTYFVLIASPATWISIPALSFAGLMVIWLGRLAFKAFRSTNWLMQIAPDGLWINLRSYQNRDFTPAATVLYVSYREIASVKQHAVERSTHTSDGSTTWTERYLDVQLVDPAPEEVGAEIAEERRRTIESVHLGGLVTSKGRSNHVPVTLPTDNVLRLAWRGRFDFIVPSLTKTLAELATHCPIAEATVKDDTDLNALSGQELDRLILDRVENGDTFGAIELLREVRGYSLHDAKKFVDGLTVGL